MSCEREPGRKLARHRGGFFEGSTGLGRARQQGQSCGVHDARDEEHAARQAHGRAPVLKWSARGHGARIEGETGGERRARERAFLKAGGDGSWRRRWLMAG